MRSDGPSQPLPLPQLLTGASGRKGVYSLIKTESNQSRVSPATWVGFSSRPAGTVRLVMCILIPSAPLN